MLGDLIAGLVEGYVASRIRPSWRWQLAARLFFGALGTGLSAAGAIVIAGRMDTANTPLRLSAILLFASMGAFCLFNIMLARRWRWPGLLFVVCFALVFMTRILFGR